MYISIFLVAAFKDDLYVINLVRYILCVVACAFENLILYKFRKSRHLRCWNSRGCCPWAYYDDREDVPMRNLSSIMQSQGVVVNYFHQVFQDDQIFYFDPLHEWVK